LLCSANADGEQLLNTDAIMSTDGKQLADEGVEGVDEDSIKKLKEKGKHLREKLDEAELKKMKIPKGNNKKVTIVQEDFSDNMDGVEEIKVRRVAATNENAASGLACIAY
jgi:hypothetical protein